MCQSAWNLGRGNKSKALSIVSNEQLGRFLSHKPKPRDKKPSLTIVSFFHVGLCVRYSRNKVLDRNGIYFRELGVVSSMTLPGGKLYQKKEFSEPTGVAVRLFYIQAQVEDWHLAKITYGCVLIRPVLCLLQGLTRWITDSCLRFW